MESLATPGKNDFHLPTRLRRLPDLAYNLWWTWHAGADRAFRWIDPEAWEIAGHNPVTFLRQVPRPALQAATRSRRYLAQYDPIVRAFDEYLTLGAQVWYPQRHTDVSSAGVTRPLALTPRCAVSPVPDPCRPRTPPPVLARGPRR